MYRQRIRILKLAVLLTGSPRFVPQGAEWWFHKSMPKNIDIDYYGHCWNTHDPIGSKYYNSTNIQLNEDYFKCWPFRDFEMSEHTTDLDLYDSVKKEDTLLSRFLLWDQRRDHTVSVHHASHLMQKSSITYDAVLIMRYDTILKPNSLDNVLTYVLQYKDNANQFHKGHDKALYYNENNPCIFTPWVQVRQGLPVMQDYMFLCSFKDWMTYTAGNLYEQYRRLLNEDKAFLEPTNFVHTIYHPHVFWAFIGLYSKANFLANNDLGAVALRESLNNIKDKDYDSIVKIHDNKFM